MFKCAVKVNKKPQTEETVGFSKGLSVALHTVLWAGSLRRAQAAEVPAVAQGTLVSSAWGMAQVALTITHTCWLQCHPASEPLQPCPWGALHSCSLSQGHACPAAAQGEL